MSTLLKKKGPAKAATFPSHGSTNPTKDMDMNTHTDSTASLRMAMASIDQVEHRIHAAWMAAHALDGDELAAGEALKAVIHSAGEWLQEVRGALRKAGVA